jgi:hypothetical protein
LESEVLRRYPDYPPARALQREWENEAIQIGLDNDAADYELLLARTNYLEEDFWSDDPKRQAKAAEQARAFDLETAGSSAGLEQARTAVERLAALPPLDNPDIERFRRVLEERTLRRRIVRLRVLLYRNQFDTFNQEFTALQAIVPKELQALQGEYQALVYLYEASSHLEQGDWQQAWSIASIAQNAYLSRARIEALIEQAQQGSAADHGVGLLLNRIENYLFRASLQPHASDLILREAHADLDRVEEQITFYSYLQRQYGARYSDGRARYLQCWIALADSILERWSYAFDELPQVIERLEQISGIAPTDESTRQRVSHLLGRVLICRVKQSIPQALLETAEDLLQQAVQQVPATDRALRETEDELRSSRRHAEFLLTTAKTHREQHEYSRAFKEVEQTLAINSESQEAQKLRGDLTAQIKAFQGRARLAHQLEQQDLERALREWEAICVLHRDGSYPADSADARPFSAWRDAARQRRDAALARMPEITRHFQGLRDLLHNQQKPDWAQFTQQRDLLLAALGEIEPGMRHPGLQRIEEAVKLLDQYQRVYQTLQRVITTPRSERTSGGWASRRSDAATALERVQVAIAQFDGGTEPVLADLATTITASYNHLVLMNELTR